MTVSVNTKFGPPSVSLEFSGPASIYGHNAYPLPLGEVTGASLLAWRAAREELPGICSFESLHLSRLDVVRTFLGVEDIPGTLLTLSQLRSSRVRTDRLERGRNGQWQSLTRGNAATWRAVLYAKAEELRDRASRTRDPDFRVLLRQIADVVQGELRYELQLRGRLRTAGLTDHTRIDETAFHFEAEDHFWRTRFAEVVDGGPARACGLVMPLDNRQQRGLLALLGADLLGLPPPMSHNPEAAYRSLQRRLGLTPQDLVPGVGVARQLDFHSGRQVEVPSLSVAPRLLLP